MTKVFFRVEDWASRCWNGSFSSTIFITIGPARVRRASGDCAEVVGDYRFSFFMVRNKSKLAEDFVLYVGSSLSGRRAVKMLANGRGKST